MVLDAVHRAQCRAKQSDSDIVLSQGNGLKEANGSFQKSMNVKALQGLGELDVSVVL